MSAQSRIARGVAANVLAQLLGAISQLILVPLFILAWGPVVYGEWLIVSAVVAYLSLADAGASLYVVNRLTQSFAKQAMHEFTTVLHSASILLMGTAAACLGCIVIVVGLLPVESIFPVTTIQPLELKFLLVVQAAQMVLLIPYGLLLGVFRAIGLLPTSVMVANAAVTAQLLLTGGALAMGARPVTVAAVQLAPYLAAGAAALWWLARHHPEVQVTSVRYYDRHVARSFIGPSMHFLMIQGAYALSIQGVVIAVGAVLGPIQVVVFVTLRTAVNALRATLALLSRTVWPEITRLDTLSRRSDLRLLTMLVLRTSVVAVLTLGVALHLLGQQIVSVWLGHTVTVDQVVIDILLFYIIQSVFWAACSNFLMAVNAHVGLARLLLVAAALSVLLAGFGAHLAGLRGAVTGLLLSEVLAPLWGVPLLLRRYDRGFSVWALHREWLAGAAGLGVVVAAPWTAPVVLLIALMWLVRAVRLGRKVRASTVIRN